MAANHFINNIILKTIMSNHITLDTPTDVTLVAKQTLADQEEIHPVRYILEEDGNGDIHLSIFIEGARVPLNSDDFNQRSC
jgi:hypothetical protein